MIDIARRNYLKYLLFGSLYVSEGIEFSLATLIVSFYLYDKGIPIQVITVVAAAALIPWSLKFFWGGIADYFLKFGRKPFIIIGGLIGAFSLFTIVFMMEGYSTNEIRQIENDSPAYISGIQEGDRLVRYNGVKVYKPIDFIQFLYITKGKPVEIEIIRDGEKIVRNFVPQIIPEHDRYLFGFSVVEIYGPDSNVVLKNPRFSTVMTTLPVLDATVPESSILIL